MESQQVLVEVPSAALAAAAEQAQTFTLPVLTATVVGSMVGVGIFSLPRAFATPPAVRGHDRAGYCCRWYVYAGTGVSGACRTQARSQRIRPSARAQYTNPQDDQDFSPYLSYVPRLDFAPLVRDDRRRKPTQPDMGTDWYRGVRNPGRLVGRSGSGATVG
jgi:hypothetical protein